MSSKFKYKEQWQLLTESLNSLGGSEKTVEQWKKVILDSIHYLHTYIF